MKKCFALMMLMALVLSLVACGGTAAPAASSGAESSAAENAENAETEPAAPARDDIIVWNSNAIDNYNPLDWYTTVQTAMFDNVYSKLIRTVYDENGVASYIGDLAESWETEEDDAVWVFHLREDAKFTNGEPVTAEDVKFSFEGCAESAYSSYKVGEVISIEARDEHTVVINTGSFNAKLPWNWTQVPIVNAKAYQENQEDYIAKQIGSGAYKLDHIEEETGDFVLVRNEEYYGEPAKIGTVTVHVNNDPSSAVIALQTGEIDYMYVSGLNYDIVSADDSLETKEQPSGYGTWLMMNPNSEVLSNKYLRQAIAYCVNYDAQYALGYGGHVSENNPTVPYCSQSTVQPEIVTTYSYNIEKAKELLAQSGLETPIDIGELYGGAGGKAELIQQDLAAIGINCEIVSLESYAMLTAYMNGDYTLGIMGGIGGGTMTPAATLFENYHVNGGNNVLLHYDNAEVNAMIEELETTKDAAKVEELTQQILEIIVDEVPVVNLGTGAYYSAYKKGLNVPVCNTGLVYFADLSWN